MSITDELRSFARDTGFELTLAPIADRIDKEHKLEVVKGLNEWKHGRDEAWDEAMEMLEREYVQLPKDADGVPIHIGDEMRADVEPSYSKHRVVGIELRESGRWSIDLLEFGLSALRPECSHHHRAPTVEDLLNEMLDVYCSNDSRTPCQLVAEYAAKLQLKEVDE